jgi:VIT1/CCC1 family predicted Fe2+/Mn2+ transporter
VIAVVGVLQLFGLGYMKAYLIGADLEKRRGSGLEILVFGAVVVFVGTTVGSLFGE